MDDRRGEKVIFKGLKYGKILMLENDTCWNLTNIYIGGAKGGKGGLWTILCLEYIYIYKIIDIYHIYYHS